MTLRTGARGAGPETTGPGTTATAAAGSGAVASGTVLPARSGRRWRAARWAVGTLLVAAVVVEVVAGRRELERAARAVTDPDWSWLVAAVVVDVASMLAYAGLQLRLLRGAGVPVRRPQATSMAFAAHSLSITLPGGPVFSTAYNYRRMGALGASRAVASWAIAVSSALSAAALALVGALAALAAGASGDALHLAVAAGVVVALAAWARHLASDPRARTLLGGSVAAVVRRVGRHDPDAALARLRAAVHQLVAVRVDAGTWAVAALAAVANWLLDALCLALCCRAAGIGGVGLVGLLLAYTAGMAASSFPVVPAGLGVVDAALSVGLVAAGAGAGQAVAAVVLFRVVSLGVVGGAGWALWTLDRRAARSTPPQSPDGPTLGT